jgi:hypothetical protein
MGPSLFSLNKALRAYDRALFAKPDFKGRVCVMRKGPKWVLYDFEGVDILVKESVEDVVFALTDNWSQSGVARDWGIEPVMQRLREIDSWSRSDFLKDWESLKDKEQEAKQRDFRRRTEDYAYEIREDFKKAFSDIRYANMDMAKDPRAKTMKG